MCAMAGAEVIYTWEVGDFIRLGPEVAKRVRTPINRIRGRSQVYSSTFLSRSEFVITETELKLMAAAARIGLRSSPKNG